MAAKQGQTQVAPTERRNMTLKQRIGELIGGNGRIRLRQINGYAPTRDFSTADYRYWDRARRAKARGLEISGLLLKPLARRWRRGCWATRRSGSRQAAQAGRDMRAPTG